MYLYVCVCVVDANVYAVIRANILEDIHKKYIMCQALRAIKYIHSAQLLHRDMNVCVRVCVYVCMYVCMYVCACGCV